MNKEYSIKVYALDGTFIKTIRKDLIMNEVSFSSKTNGGQGECTIELSLPIDDFDEGVSISWMNFVRIYESDPVNHPDPVLIYTGYISQYTPFFEEGRQGVRVTLLGLVSLLSLAYFKSGGSFAVTSNQDPAATFRDIINQLNSIYPGSWLSYTGASIVDVGASVNLTLTDTKWLEALKKAFDLGSTARFWTVGSDGLVYFLPKPSTATHRFTIGSDVSRGEVVKNSEQIVNSYQLRWGPGPTPANYSDATSITRYGKHELVESDTAITAVGGADRKGNKKIADQKDGKTQARLHINASYDIETIHPGDTCSVFNIKQGSTTFPANMMITSVTYTPDGVDIELENDKSSFADAFAAAVDNV